MKLKITIAIIGLILSTSSYGQVKKWTLEECVNYALENNISIQQSELDVQSSEYTKKSAVGNFLPSVNANATHNWNHGLTTDVTTGNLKLQTTQNTSIGLTAGVNLFQGLSNLNQMHRANLEILASRYQIDGMKDDISLMVANSYLQVLFNKQTLAVRQSQYNLTQEDIKRTRELIANGQLPEGEIYEIEASAANQSQLIVEAENNIRISLISLAQLLLISDYENFDIAGDEDYDVSASTIINTNPAEIYQKALQIRNEIKISETQVDIAEKDYDLAVGGVSPTLSAFYSYNTRAAYQGRTESTFDQFRTNSGNVFGLQLNVPIFNGFSNHVNMQKNRLNVEKAKLNLENTKIDLESTVYQSYSDAAAAAKAFEAAEKTLVAREQAYAYAEERYNVGVINSFEFIQTQQALEAAQSEVIRSKFDYIFKLKVIEFYFGIPITQ
ncbi:hypothetical protein BFP72_04110 [Reichenbachiella sp. 5M10]|uniref:TolC family protein n=1 Tax=Reichenbachiella sp. 5M10 TaxID=1889772 RepID=UPI000C15C871|nr:TolC family protein [Reichenbachiella sp. 5M10]PIB34651.1 hypothetical protein BFP72_04110 [Reichenbachiella sp. 5M10]